MKGISGVIWVFIIIALGFFAFMGISGAIDNIQSSFSGNITGNGTAGYIPRFMNATTVNNSIMRQIGNGIAIGAPFFLPDPTLSLETENGIAVQNGNVTSPEMTVLNTLWTTNIKPIPDSGDEVNIIGDLTAATLLFTGNVVTAIGKMGIGTVNPIEKLDLRGNANITGWVNASKYYGDGSALTGIVTGGGGNPFNQNLNTTNSPRFNALTLDGNLNLINSISFNNTETGSISILGINGVPDLAGDGQAGSAIKIQAGASATVNTPNIGALGAPIEIIAGAGSLGTGQNVNGGNLYLMGGPKSGIGKVGNIFLGSNMAASTGGQVGIITQTPRAILEVLGTLYVSKNINASGITINLNTTPANYVAAISGSLNVSGILNTTNLTIRRSFQARNATVVDTCVMASGTCTINNGLVTASTIIICTQQADGGTIGSIRISARTAGTSYTVTSTNVLDTSTVGCLLIEPRFG